MPKILGESGKMWSKLLYVRDKYDYSRSLMLSTDNVYLVPF